ncbi:MAG TPA: Ig-like domain-containing protein [Fimbriimonadaceae bacterium]|nr:Ig-like domain-containing protein [Fimbriimonadaceae bacterium]
MDPAVNPIAFVLRPTGGSTYQKIVLPMGGFSRSQAHGINDSNHVVGRVRDATGWRACYWLSTGTETYSTPVVLTDYESIATDINNQGRIVGERNNRGFYYNGTLYDVNNLPIGGVSGINGAYFDRVLAINDRPDGFFAFAAYGWDLTGTRRSMIARSQDGLGDDQGAIGSVSIVGGNGGDPLGTAIGRFDFSYNSNPDGIAQDRRVNLFVTGGDARFANGLTSQTIIVGRNNSSTPNFDIITGYGSIGQRITISSVVDGYETFPASFNQRRANTRVTTTGGTVRYFEPMNISANLALSELDLRALADQTLIWSYGGSDLGSAVTNSAGNATILTPTPGFVQVGQQVATVRFDGSSQWNSSFANVTITVDRAPTVLSTNAPSGTCGAVLRLQATLRRSYDSVPIVGKSVSFSVSGVGTVGSGVTNASGVAVFDWLVPIGFPRGSRAFTTSFAGDSIHGASNENGTMTIQNSIPVASIAGSALSLNGSSDYVQLPSSTWFDGSPFTIEGWTMVRNHTLYSRFMEFGNTNGGNTVGINLSYDSSGQPYGYVVTGANSFIVGPAQTISTNQWNHVATVFTGSALQLLINGNIVAQISCSAPLAVTRSLNFFGRSTYSIPYFMNGIIDEIRVWNVARSVQQIQTSRFMILDPTSPGLVGYWNFDLGLGGQALDLSLSARHGNLVGTWDWRASTAPISTVGVEFETARSFILGAFDADRDMLTAEIVTPTSFGTLDVSGLNATYVPACGFVGNDTFTYRVSDGTATSNTTTVTLAVTNTKSALPTSVAVILGEEFSGNLQSLLCSDDNRFILLSDSSMLGLIEIGSALPAGKTLQQVRLESSVARPGLQEVHSLYNWVNPGWNVVNGRTATLVDSQFVINVSSGTLYTSSTGGVRLRVQWNPLNDEDPAVDGWALSVDSVRFRY